jgi:hypothetical protein
MQPSRSLVKSPFHAYVPVADFSTRADGSARLPENLLTGSGLLPFGVQRGIAWKPSNQDAHSKSLGANAIQGRGKEINSNCWSFSL